MQVEKIEESIRVCAAFDSGKMIPVWFRWKNRYYKVKNITKTWMSTGAEGRVRHFAVYDGANLYELCFNIRSLEWILGRISSE